MPRVKALPSTIGYLHLLMFVSTRFIVTLALVTGFLPAHSQSDSSSELRQTVQNWVETMAAIQKEEDSWQKDRDVLQNYREGLKTEIKTLESQLKDAKVLAGKASTEDEEKIAKKEAFEAAAEDLNTRVIALEERMGKMLHLVPLPLMESEKFETALKGLKKTLQTSDRSKMKGAPGRLQTVLILLTEMEKFQNTVTVRTDFHTASDGKKYEVSVIYLGLAKAYAVNEQGSFAEVGAPGLPGAEGWTFSEDNSLAADILTLVQSTKGETDAQFVTVPLSLR